MLIFNYMYAYVYRRSWFAIKNILCNYFPTRTGGYVLHDVTNCHYMDTYNDLNFSTRPCQKPTQNFVLPYPLLCMFMCDYHHKLNNLGLGSVPSVNPQHLGSAFNSVLHFIFLINSVFLVNACAVSFYTYSLYALFEEKFPSFLVSCFCQFCQAKFMSDIKAIIWLCRTNNGERWPKLHWIFPPRKCTKIRPF